jgi:energy-coupling factor transporter ATP-binding protein EcfA2
VLRELNERDGMTIFLVEQNAYHALALAHRGYVMVNGRVVLSGTGRELLSMPEVRAAYLEGSARPVAEAAQAATQAIEAAIEVAPDAPPDGDA